MTKKLSFKESIFIGSMLFGLFFGAGNLIFPVHMGQEAGSAVFWQILDSKLPELACLWVLLPLVYQKALVFMNWPNALIGNMQLFLLFYFI